MITCISPLFSSSSLSLEYWISKLGERAFLAWLRFQSWRDGQASIEEPFHLPLSLNKVIQRLGMGKSTFYNKILKPLVQHGLIQLQPTSKASGEMHLVVYDLPESTPSHSQEEETCLEQTACDSKPAPLPQPEAVTPSDDTPTTLESLPDDLQELIQQDPRLHERKDGIIQTYHQCREHPQFHKQDFKQKLQTCITYPHQKHRFGAYLRKALHNEWNKPSPLKKSPPIPQQPRPSDVPPWVLQQQEQEKSQIPPPKESLTADQQAILDGLLRDLGEMP